MIKAFAQGARGFVVSNLQRAMGIVDDGDFGPKSKQAVKDYQVALGHVPTGRACQSIFDTLGGVRWPSLFERCLNITGAFEGTGFGGVNRTDIDKAGVTLGIAGFTTDHGEVQDLIREYIKLRPSCLEIVPSPAREKLLVLCNSTNLNCDAWEKWFYGGDGVVDKWIRDIVATWGKEPLFQKLQIATIETKMWLPAMKAAHLLGLETEHGKALMFDIQVQNGGWRKEHQRHYDALDNKNTEKGRRLAVATAVAACAKSRFQTDVRRRKVTLATGSGVVHGRSYDMTDFGFDQI